MSYRCGSDLELEKIRDRLVKQAMRRLFHPVPSAPGYSYTYLEEELYLIRNDMTNVLYFAEGRNPRLAYLSVFAKEAGNDERRD